MRVREIEERDIDRLLWLESIVWRGAVQFKEEHLRSQIRIFPEGQLCFEDDEGEIWGFVNLMRFRFDPRSPLRGTWRGITADGYISTHDPRGNWLFGVNLSVHPHGFFTGATEALLGTAARVCASRHLKGIMFVGRMPGYARWLRARARSGTALDGADVEVARSYIDARRTEDDGRERRLDSQLAMYETFGLRILGPVPDFMDDEKSRDFGIAMVWSNFLYVPFYLFPSKRAWKAIVYGPVGRLIYRTYIGLVNRADGVKAGSAGQAVAAGDEEGETEKRCESCS